MLVKLFPAQAWTRANLLLLQLTPNRSSVPLSVDPTLYRSLAGALQYLTFTHPDISYVVQQVYLHMHAPCTDHVLALKRILCYVKRTLHYGLHLVRVDALTHVVIPLAIVCFLVTTSFPGLLRDKPHFLALVQKLSTRVLLMWYLNLVCFATFSWSFISHSLGYFGIL